MSEQLEQKESFLSIISYNMADLVLQTSGMAFGAFFLLFWETEVGLNIWILTLAYTIYAVWNAINDPLVGYFADRPKKFWGRYGKRFPWIMIAAIPAILLAIVLFTPPDVDPVNGQWILFAWILIFLCIYELFLSIFSLNHAALFFKSSQNRAFVKEFCGRDINLLYGWNNWVKSYSIHSIRY